MLTKTKIALAAALILGPASAVLANEGGEETGGGPVQTWQDIQRSAQDSRYQIKKQHHAGNAGSSYGLVKSPKQTHPASHEPSQDR
jgi:hypothetical protein